MSLLITGAAGMLGSELVALAGSDALATDKDDLNILDADAVSAVLRQHRPQWVINCAAFTRVDDCEGNPDAFRLNAEGPEVLARCCRETGTRLLHISTDYVFDGQKGTPYMEDDEPNPLNDYGRGKLEGERRALDAHPDGVTIVRTAWMFGANGPCFPKTILNAARQGRGLRVVSDQTGCPTSATDLAHAILRLLALDAPPGVFHIVNSGSATWHEVALATLTAAGIEAEVEAIRTEDWPTRARRPRYSVLDCSKAHRLGVPPLRAWREALTEFVHRISRKAWRKRFPRARRSRSVVVAGTMARGDGTGKGYPREMDESSSYNPVRDLELRTRSAVQAFWAARERQQAAQAAGERPDTGSRGAATGGKQMDGFLWLIRDVLLNAGVSPTAIVTRKRVELPGYYRPTKQWDLLVVTGGRLVAAMEAKSHIGPSFGNNVNNRVEEAVGSAADLWTAFREGAFGGGGRPWLGYLLVLEDSDATRRSTRAHEPHFAVFPEFRGASYMTRYELFCRKLVRERQYDAAALLLTRRDEGVSGQYSEPAPDLAFGALVRSLVYHVKGHL